RSSPSILDRAPASPLRLAPDQDRMEFRAGPPDDDVPGRHGGAVGGSRGEDRAGAGRGPGGGPPAPDVLWTARVERRPPRPGAPGGPAGAAGVRRARP